MTEETKAVAAPAKKSGFIAFFSDSDDGEDAPRQRWAGSTTFILAAIGSAIGLGNFWRFPYLTFKWGGGIWFIPYLIALMFLGLPMMMLELSLGQLFQRGDIGVFRGIHPRLYGVGLASVFSAFAINIFYTYLIAIAGCYFFAGFQSPLPWSIQRTSGYQSVFCTQEAVCDNGEYDIDADTLKAVPKADCETIADPRVTVNWNKLGWECEAPARCEQQGMYITEEWFRMDLLKSYVMTKTSLISEEVVEDGVVTTPAVWAEACQEYDTSFNPTGKQTVEDDVRSHQDTEFSGPIMGALALTWIITYFCVFKGVKSSSYVVWFTVPGPILFIFIMVMNNLCLPNADAGIRMYLRGIDPETEKAVDPSVLLGNGQMWADAVGQIFFSLGVCMGVMTSYASYNRKNKPIIRDVFVISFGNCALSFFAGFAVFSVVGYLNGVGSPVRNNTSSSGLAFVAYPAAAEEMPGSNFWIILLGLTLFTLGIDTAFSLVEAISTVVYDTEKGKAIPRKLTALIVCILGWCGSLLYCPSWGFTHFDVADRYLSVYLMFILGIMQCFAAGWAFRLQKVLTDENKMSIYLLSLTYWVSLLIMAPVTVFGLGAPINVRQHHMEEWATSKNEAAGCLVCPENEVCDEGMGQTEAGEECSFLTAADYEPFSAMWLGVVIFWALNLIVIAVTFFMKKGSASDWYKNVFFYGAHELAELVANKSDELRQEGNSAPQPCWKPVFIFWWSFSIKYFIPWALLSLMMWNFKADINLSYKGTYQVTREETTIDPETQVETTETITEDIDWYRGYGSYHDMWQIVGFIYPLIGLICFLIPICIVTTPEEKLSKRDADGKLIERIEVDLDVEEDKVHREAEIAYVKGLQAAKDALMAMNKIHENVDGVATKA